MDNPVGSLIYIKEPVTTIESIAPVGRTRAKKRVEYTLWWKRGALKGNAFIEEIV